MSNIRSSEDDSVKFAKLMAEMFYFMSDEIISELGEKKGKEIVERAIRKFGESRVASMKEEAEERGMELNRLDTYMKVRDMPSKGWVNDSKNPMDILYCPMEDIWSEHGENGRRIGYMYCKVDEVLFGGFGIKLSRPECLAKGDKRCKFELSFCGKVNSDGK